MSLLPLFGDDDRPPLAASLAPRLRGLADEGVYFGTSSWKYPGWLGSIYTEDRYRVRGRFSLRKFEDECLAEYARTFPVVGGDFSFYQFPTPSYWRKIFESAPEPLQFGLKVPEEITVSTWPGHARYGPRAGQCNPSFLDARLFVSAFAEPLIPHRDRVAVLMFEFGTFPKSAFAAPEPFLDRLAEFLADLPEGFRYAVEIRNPEFLGPDYFRVLAAHHAAHVFNAWTRMPELKDQVAMPGAYTADFAVVRALLRKGRGYDQAVQRFEPYREVQEPNAEARSALTRIADEGRRRRRPTFLFVNNRLEGFAPGTIEAVVSSLAP
jgi:uncharacterized protein YecE (DUF72 family)